MRVSAAPVSGRCVGRVVGNVFRVCAHDLCSPVCADPVVRLTCLLLAVLCCIAFPCHGAVICTSTRPLGHCRVVGCLHCEFLL